MAQHMQMAAVPPSAPSGPAIGRLLVVGMGVFLLFFVGFGGWAALAPLDSAAVSIGKVVVDGQRKTVQHLEGGIVAEILVRDGDAVELGETVIRLEDTQARASLALVRSRLDSALALRARLLAERDSLREITYPTALTDRSHEPAVAALMAAQERVLQGRVKSHGGRVAILKQSIAEFREEIKGLNQQIAAEDDQIRIVKIEIKDVATLQKKGLAPKPRLLALERRFAEIRGSKAGNRARISQIMQSIGQSELEIQDLEIQRVNEILTELRDVEREISDVSERVKAAEDVLARTLIPAPIGGMIVALDVSTVGGVIAPGAALMDIVPQGSNLVIEARMSPTDIDVVEAGLPAQVRLTALSQRDIPPFVGRVMSVSADSLEDRETKQRYYLVRVSFDANEVRKVTGKPPYPGMEAEVFIVTGERTMFDYIVGPMLQSLNRSFKEN